MPDRLRIAQIVQEATMRDLDFCLDIADAILALDDKEEAPR